MDGTGSYPFNHGDGAYARAGGAAGADPRADAFRGTRLARRPLRGRAAGARRPRRLGLCRPADGRRIRPLSFRTLRFTCQFSKGRIMVSITPSCYLERTVSVPHDALGVISAPVSAGPHDDYVVYESPDPEQAAAEQAP